jgi:hypothetical protein
VYGKSGALKHYKVTPGGRRSQSKEIPPAEIIHLKFKNPKNKNRGFSPSLAGGPWIDANEAIEESRIRTFSNSIAPSVWLKVVSDDVNPQDPVLAKIKERWIQRAAGISKHREPQIIPPGVEIDDTGNYTPKEMDYKSSSPEVRDNILALRGVNKFIAGFTEGMNRAQVETAMVHFCELVISPLLRMLSGALQEFLVPLFDSNIKLWFPDCSPENREIGLEEMKFRWMTGSLSPNQIRAKFGDTAIDHPDYNSGYIGGGLVPLGVNPSGELPGEDEEFEGRDVALDIYGGLGASGNGRPVVQLEDRF